MKSIYLIILLSFVFVGCNRFYWQGQTCYTGASADGKGSLEGAYCFDTGTTSSADDSLFLNVSEHWTIKKDDSVFVFRSEPAAPASNKESVIELTVQKAVNGALAPVTDATVTSSAVMPKDQPNMQGILHTYKIHTVQQGAVPGVYSMPITYGMPGKWVVKYHIAYPDATEFDLSFPLVVEK